MNAYWVSSTPPPKTTLRYEATRYPHGKAPIYTFVRASLKVFSSKNYTNAFLDKSTYYTDYEDKVTHINYSQPWDSFRKALTS